MRQNRMRRPETYLADSRRVPKDRWGHIPSGIEVWKIGEVIVLEITDNTAHRKEDAKAGFSMLEP